MFIIDYPDRKTESLPLQIPKVSSVPLIKQRPGHHLSEYDLNAIVKTRKLYIVRNSSLPFKTLYFSPATEHESRDFCEGLGTALLKRWVILVCYRLLRGLCVFKSLLLSDLNSNHFSWIYIY